MTCIAELISGRLLPLVSALMISSLAAAQGVAADSTMNSQENNSALFLNASSDSKPRQISLGLPTTAGASVMIYEDGLPVSYYTYQLQPHKGWHGGVSASRTSSMGPFETALRSGDINTYVTSDNLKGGEVFGGTLNYTVGSFGQHKLDVNVNGPLFGGLRYSLSTYQNLDPGSNHIAYPEYKDRHQFYKGVLSRSFADGRGDVSLVYQHVEYRNLSENFGPFVFVGDGSVKRYGDFSLGTDSYRPDEKEFVFMDFMTGEMRTMDFVPANMDRTDHVTLAVDYLFGDGTKLQFRSRYKDGTSVRGAGTMAGIDFADTGSGYSYPDGSSFTGYIQKRQILHFDAFDTMVLNNLELTGRSGEHSWTAGADLHFDHGGTVSSSSIFAHEVKADPSIIMLNGEKYYNYNTSGEYYDGREVKSALYFQDGWKHGRLDAAAFLRLEDLHIWGDAANNVDGDRSNTRKSGFNMTMGKVTPFDRRYLNGAAGLQLNFRLAGPLVFQSDAVFTRIHRNIFNFGGFNDPNDDPTDTYLIRAGFSYQNRWVNVLSQLNYIHQSNYNQRTVFQHVLQKDVNGLPAGYTESLALPVVYGVASLGWVTDAMLTPFDGFSVHVQLTLRNPQYCDFLFTPTFSDGVSESYDFSGKNVTNLHKTEIVVDPSYTAGPWRLWLSARYISRTYINKTNSLFFKGRVETFGGADYSLNSKVKLSLNLVNLLNQKGASGAISSADLVEDASGYRDYVMAGTFIRPFTVELGVKVGF